MNIQEQRIKKKFYILSIIGFLMVGGSLFVGHFLDVYGKKMSEVPSYKNYIFSGCIILCCVYCFFYIKYMIKNESYLCKNTRRHE